MLHGATYDYLVIWQVGDGLCTIVWSERAPAGDSAVHSIAWHDIALHRVTTILNEDPARGH